MGQNPNNPLANAGADPDRLTGQLMHLPRIIRDLGLSIAEAQKALNRDFVGNVGRLLEMIQQNLPDRSAQGADAMVELLKALAPSRYQFTETTIEFSADLSESREVVAGGAVAVNMRAVAVSAAVSMAYGYDYRAAARIRSVLHAMPVGAALADKLIERAQEIVLDENFAKALPARTTIDTQLGDGVKALGGMLGRS